MLNSFFPFLAWLKNYNFEKFRIDGVAGLTVALVLIPQSMAYAQLAGLPPYYGLYASFIPPMLAALFGSSHQLATGPVAVVSLMTAASLEPLAIAGSEGYIVYAILLALIVGLFQFSLGVLRLGLIVNFLSHPVVNGFTNAAAIIIASSQLSKLFGVYVDKSEHHYETIINVCKAAIQYTHWFTLFMGVLAFIIMYGLNRISPKIPNVLVAVLITILISTFTGFEHNTIVDIKRIKSPNTLALISQFNNAVKSIAPFADKRAQINSVLKKAENNHDIIGMHDAQYKINLTNIEMTRLKELAHDLREQIRCLFFEGVHEKNELVFYLKDDIPNTLKGDGRTWRIKIGNKPLQENNLLIMGGGSVVGDIPRGLPAFTVPAINLQIILQLLPYAAIISLLGFMEAISIAKAMAAKTGQRLDPNQELIGQGLANIIGALGKSYPVSGSFSRSAVNLQAGAVTGLSSVVTSFTVIIVLLFFTSYLYNLPQSVLAAVIMMAVIGLVNVRGFIHAWKAQWYDGAISIITFICTLAFAPHLDKGIIVGVGLSLIVFLYKSMRPNVSYLSRHKDDSLRDSIIFGLEECAHIAVVRFDAPLFFANASYLEDQISEIRQNMEGLRHIHIVCNGINDIDASGEEALSLIIERIRSANLGISFSGINESVVKVFKRTHLLEKIGTENIYPTMEKAIYAIHEYSHLESHELSCPLRPVEIDRP